MNPVTMNDDLIKVTKSSLALNHTALIYNFAVSCSEMGRFYY